MSYASFGQPGERPDNDRSLAPYLTVLGAGGPEGTERVPLKETTADVSIAGVIARVQVHQLFENTGRVPIEAVYVFPASTRAAVHGVRMKIGQRVDRGEDRSQAGGARELRGGAPRGQARVAARAGAPQRVHDERRQHHAGRSHRRGDGLLRDAGPRRGDLRVRLPDGRRPALHGRRRSARRTSGWRTRTCPRARRSRTSSTSRSTSRRASRSRSCRRRRTRSRSTTRARRAPTCALAIPGGGNRDFVLRYRLSGDKIESGLLLWEGEGGQAAVARTSSR